jgi:hypothetical protein
VQGVQPCTRPVTKEFVEGAAAIAEASITEEVTDALPFPAVPYEVAEYAAAFILRSDVESVADEGYASFIESAAEACTAWASVAKGVAAVAEEPLVSSAAAEECPASVAVQAAAACTVAAEGPPAAIAEGHTAEAAKGSSSEVDTSAGLKGHTRAAGEVAHSTLTAAGASSGIVVEPSIEAEADISIDWKASYQHLHGY